jgi:hypothetical protein
MSEHLTVEMETNAALGPRLVAVPTAVEWMAQVSPFTPEEIPSHFG